MLRAAALREGDASMIAVEQAVGLLMQEARRCPPCEVDLLEADDMMLAEDIVSFEDIPSFARAAVDGYAVRAADSVSASPAGPVRISVIGSIAAGQWPERGLTPGCAAEISTGGPVPPGADAVVRQEDVTVGRDWVELRGTVQPGANVGLRGEDVRAGTRVLLAGTIIRPAEIGLLASLGRHRVRVIGRPKVAIMPTGNEVVGIEAVPGPAQIRNSGAYGIAASVRRSGGDLLLGGVAPDEPRELGRRLRALAGHDLILTTGGVSVGPHDLIRQVLVAAGAELLFSRVAMRPGTAVLGARLGGSLVVGLSGNPVAAMTSFEILVRPALAAMLGRPFRRDMFSAVLEQEIQGSSVRRYMRARLGNRNGCWRADVAMSQKSGVLSSLASANGYVIIPERSGRVPQGSEVQSFTLWGCGPSRAG